MAIEGRQKPLTASHIIIPIFPIERLKRIGNLDIYLCVVPPSESKTIQQLIAYEPKAVLWLGFKPQPVGDPYKGMEVLNINDQKQYWTRRGEEFGLIIKKSRIFQTLYIDGLAEWLDTPPSYDPPSYEESCLPPHDKKGEMTGDK